MIIEVKTIHFSWAASKRKSTPPTLAIWVSASSRCGRATNTCATWRTSSTRRRRATRRSDTACRISSPRWRFSYGSRPDSWSRTSGSWCKMTTGSKPCRYTIPKCINYNNYVFYKSENLSCRRKTFVIIEIFFIFPIMKIPQKKVFSQFSRWNFPLT